MSSKTKIRSSRSQLKEADASLTINTESTVLQDVAQSFLTFYFASPTGEFHDIILREFGNVRIKADLEWVHL